MITPSSLLIESASEDQPSQGIFASLSEIAKGSIQSIADAARDRVISNITRSSNTQPSPDLTAVAAQPQKASFLDGAAFGVSMPILLIGGAALVYLLIRRK